MVERNEPRCLSRNQLINLMTSQSILLDIVEIDSRARHQAKMEQGNDVIDAGEAKTKVDST